MKEGLKYLSVVIAEKCGWLANVNRDLIKNYITDYKMRKAEKGIVGRLN